MDVDIEIRGLKEIDEVLKRLPERVARRALDSALRSGANIVKKAAELKAPVYQGPMKIVKYRGKKRAIIPRLLRFSIIVKKDKSGASSANYKVGTSKRAFYGHFVEFGRVKMRAQPFLRPAFDETKEQVIRQIGKQLGNNVEREALKLAGQYKARKR